MVQKEERLKQELGEVQEEMMNHEEDAEEPNEKFEMEGEIELKEEKIKVIEKKGIEMQSKMEGEGNLKAMKGNETDKVAKERKEIIGAELRGLLETVVEESGMEPLKRVLENMQKDLNPNRSLALEYFM